MQVAGRVTLCSSLHSVIEWRRRASLRTAAQDTAARGTAPPSRSLA
ncbi:hypothetical protein ACFPM0_31790 [Pseudonocardia sulfidoxydans]